MRGGHGGGAVVVAEVVAAVGVGPEVEAGFEGGVGPGGVGLELVVVSAQGGQVAGAGRAPAGVGAALAVVAVGISVVEVAGVGGSGAPGEDAGGVEDPDGAARARASAERAALSRPVGEMAARFADAVAPLL